MMQAAIGLLLAVATVCLPALGQDTSAFDAKQSLGVTASYSPTSSHILIGISQKRRIFTAGVEYTRRFWESGLARLDYSGEFSPFFRERDPTMVGTESTSGGFPYLTSMSPERVIEVDHEILGDMCVSICYPIYPVYGHDESTYAASISPLGARAVLRPQHRVQPTFETNLGAIISTRDIPVDHASLFNYQFSFGPGVQIFATHNTALRFEYVYRHISNAWMGAMNPGIDQRVFRLTLSRYR